YLNSPASSQATARTKKNPLTAPTGVAVETPTASTWLDVKWLPVSNAGSYRIYYSPSSPVTASSTFVAYSNKQDVSGYKYQRVSSLNAGTTYYFKVVATAGASSSYADSPLSAQASATTTAAPTAPTNVQATVAADTVTLSWAHSPAGGVKSYTVKYSKNADFSASDSTGVGKQKTYKVSGLDAQSTYHFKIIATYAYGDAAQESAVKKVTTPKAKTKPTTKAELKQIIRTRYNKVYDSSTRTSAPDLTDIDVSAITDMSYLFTTLNSQSRDLNSNQLGGFNGDISNWDVSNVTNMEGMFLYVDAFNQDISSWNVGSVTNMSHMFRGAESFNQNIGSWTVSAVSNMEGMFREAEAFNQNIGSWTVSAVSNMKDMFYWAEAFNQDIGDWNTSAVTNMEGMFYSAKLFNQDINTSGNKWNVSNVTNMYQMFAGANSAAQTAFNQDISAWNTARVTNMENMFYLAGQFDQDLSGWSVSSVRNNSWVFKRSAMESKTNRHPSWPAMPLPAPQVAIMSAPHRWPDSLIVFWPVVQGATGYKVYYSTSPNVTASSTL
ncbi:MAG: BspA family leucine-rich repeat surface protein, partial [Spirochaetota bacterium]